MISALGIEYSYGNGQGLHHASFSRLPGRLTAMIGPNGAGKTTAMRMLAGVLAPQSGDISYYGLSLAENREVCQAMLGYLGEGAALPLDLTGRDSLRFEAAIFGIARPDIAAQVDHIAEICGCADALDTPVANLSKGMKRRVALAHVLIKDPKILLLDEPMDGLDPIQKEAMRHTLRALAQDRIIIFSTHALEDVAAIADDVLAIADGRIVLDGPLSDMAPFMPDMDSLTDAAPQFSARAWEIAFQRVTQLATKSDGGA